MSWREFIASLVDSLAWPVAVVVLVWLVRGQLAGLLTGVGPLRRLKVGPGGAEAEWDIAAEHVASSSVRALPVPEDIDAELDAAEQLVDTAPTVAVAKAWEAIERQLRYLVDASDAKLPEGQQPTAGMLVNAALMEGAIGPDAAEPLRGMLVLRNLAAHDPSGTTVSARKAREFVTLARGVLFTMRAQRDRRGEEGHGG